LIPEREVLDLKITNRGKDLLIEQLNKERNGFFEETMKANRRVGELETLLLQLETPRERGRETEQRGAHQ
jgi:hypothetical protein